MQEIGFRLRHFLFVSFAYHLICWTCKWNILANRLKYIFCLNDGIPSYNLQMLASAWASAQKATGRSSASAVLILVSVDANTIIIAVNAHRPVDIVLFTTSFTPNCDFSIAQWIQLLWVLNSEHLVWYNHPILNTSMTTELQSETELL